LPIAQSILGRRIVRRRRTYIIARLSIDNIGNRWWLPQNIGPGPRIGPRIGRRIGRRIGPRIGPRIGQRIGPRIGQRIGRLTRCITILRPMSQLITASTRGIQDNGTNDTPRGTRVRTCPMTRVFGPRFAGFMASATVRSLVLHTTNRIPRNGREEKNQFFNRMGQSLFR
jgi:hypothetical protein